MDWQHIAQQQEEIIKGLHAKLNALEAQLQMPLTPLPTLDHQESPASTLPIQIENDHGAIIDQETTPVAVHIGEPSVSSSRQIMASEMSLHTIDLSNVYLLVKRIENAEFRYIVFSLKDKSSDHELFCIRKSYHDFVILEQKVLKLI